MFANSRIAIGLLFVLTACGSDPDDSQADLCSPSDAPVVVLGQGVGGAFEPFADGEEVPLAVAPQGGFGVAVVVQTEGLLAGDETTATVRLAVEIEGSSAGEFELEDPLLCQADGSGGRIFGQVVGLDPDVYSTNDDLVALHGQAAVLDVTITDEEGNVGEARQMVTITSEG